MREKTAALAGNPNVGKSTLFNALTGMKQHTGNWPGKTVESASGHFETKQNQWSLIDLPGTYSLMAHSVEEEIARNYICFGGPDTVVVVCDATCLERNLNLALQTMEMASSVIVCVNLMDEAKKKGIEIDLPGLSKRLGIPVAGITARKKKSLAGLLEVLEEETARKEACTIKEKIPVRLKVSYGKAVETALSIVEPSVRKVCEGRLNSRWLSLRLLEGDEGLIKEASSFLEKELMQDEEISRAVCLAQKSLSDAGILKEALQDIVVSALVFAAEEICDGVVSYQKKTYRQRDLKIDRLLTSRFTGYPVMLLLLAAIFWLTITGANYPSRLLAEGLFFLQDKLTALFLFLHAPDWLHGVLVLGVYRTLAWVISVMLPPMAIFFPLFTLLEDVGYLPRIAYNLDKPFCCCHACGKQALTMCMGFGCNAAGVVGCRIIDSPRERLLAIVTNAFVPCNGRFPTLIALITMFFVGTKKGLEATLLSTLFLTGLIVFSVVITFFVTGLLSKTLLRGLSSSYTLELPPYRKPQAGRVIVRSLFDRTLFVLGRAVAVAAPAGLIIWILANLSINGVSLLGHISAFLDPFARLMGLDGVILMAFILAFPANEIVIPIILMTYLCQGSLLEMDSLAQMRQLFADNGWTWVTAVCTMLFSLMHWPCSTTLLTIKKETGSLKWTVLATALPTAAGILCCMLFAQIAGLFL